MRPTFCFRFSGWVSNTHAFSSSTKNTYVSSVYPESCKTDAMSMRIHCFFVTFNKKLLMWDQKAQEWMMHRDVLFRMCFSTRSPPELLKRKNIYFCTRHCFHHFIASLLLKITWDNLFLILTFRGKNDEGRTMSVCHDKQCRIVQASLSHWCS